MTTLVMVTFILLKMLEALDKFKQFKAEVENQHDLKIKIVRSDHGGLIRPPYTI